MREPEGGRLNRVFIGRHAEREAIKTRLGEGERVLLLYGQPMVGKARLASQVAEELQAENEAQGREPIVVYTVDCKTASDWPDVMKALCLALSLGEAFTNENLLLGAVLDRLQVAKEGRGGVMLLMLKLHSLVPQSEHMESFNLFLNSLTNHDVTTIVTSRRPLLITSKYFVKAMSTTDCLQLLRQHARDANVEDFVGILEKHCHGLPPLVLQVAQFVSGDPMLAYTADELSQALDEDPSLLMKGLGEEAKQIFSGLSPVVQSHVATLAQLLDGTFSMEALQAALGLEGARAKTVIRRLCEESPLVIDVTSQRMFIEPVVLHHVRKLGHMTADDQARLRVVTLIGRVLTQAERELYIEGQNTVYGHLHGDWPQLQLLLRQAIHCTDNTYHAYLKVAVESDKLLVKCFPEEALQFYHAMAAAAIRFGTPRDQAVLQGLTGMVLTQGQGTGWHEALQYYHRALPVLQQDPRSINLPRLLCDMGFTYFRLNQLHEADRCLQEALQVSHLTEVEEERQVFLLIRARSLLALPGIFRGHYAACKQLLEETLEICSQQAPHHPDIPILINSMGLVFERSGTSQEMAMQYYLSSLAERRRYASVAPGDMVPCLNNIGMQYGRQGNFDLAFKHLEEAAAIRAKSGRWHYYTALTQQHLGQLCLQKGEYKRAERHLLEAAQVYARCTPGHDVRGKVALCLGHVYITPPFCDVASTKKYLTQVCELSEASGEDLSDSGLMVAMSAVQHRMQLEGWQAQRVRTLLKWTQQLLDQFTGDPSKQIAEHKSILEAADALSDPSSTELQKESVMSRIMANCQMCNVLAINGNVRDLWREMEKQTEKVRKAKSVLLGSETLAAVIQLSGQSERRVTDAKTYFLSGNTLLLEERKTGCPQVASAYSETSTLPIRNQNLVPQTPGFESRLAGYHGRAAVEQGREEFGRPRVQFAPFDTRPAAWAADQSEKLGLFGVYEEAQQLRETAPGIEHRRHSSCSFTSSEPLSSTDSDVTAPPTPQTMPAEHLSEVTYFRGRFIYPLQETARDQQYLHAGLTNSLYDAYTSDVVLTECVDTPEESFDRGIVKGVRDVGDKITDPHQISEAPRVAFCPPVNSRQDATQRDFVYPEGCTALKLEKPEFDIQPLRTLFSAEPLPFKATKRPTCEPWQTVCYPDSHTGEPGPTQSSPGPTQPISEVSHPGSELTQFSCSVRKLDDGLIVQFPHATAEYNQFSPELPQSSPPPPGQAKFTNATAVHTQFSSRVTHSNLPPRQPVSQYTPSTTVQTQPSSELSQFSTPPRPQGSHFTHSGAIHTQFTQFQHPPSQPIPQFTDVTAVYTQFSSQSSPPVSSRPKPTLQDFATCAHQILTALPSSDTPAVSQVVTAEQRRALEKLASLHDTDIPLANLTIEEQRIALCKLASQQTDDRDYVSSPPQSSSAVSSPLQSSSSVYSSPHSLSAVSSQPQSSSAMSSPLQSASSGTNSSMYLTPHDVPSQTPSTVASGKSAFASKVEMLSCVAKVSPDTFATHDDISRHGAEISQTVTPAKVSPFAVPSDTSRLTPSNTPMMASSESYSKQTVNTSSYGTPSQNTALLTYPSTGSSRGQVFSSSRVPCESDSLDCAKTPTHSSITADIHLRVGVTRTLTPSGSAAVNSGTSSLHAPREAIENDERLENPGHVCTSVDCACSLQGTRM